MQDIKRYVCQQCGIVTRAEDWQSHESCGCGAGYAITDEAVEQPQPTDEPHDPPTEEN